MQECCLIVDIKRTVASATGLKPDCTQHRRSNKLGFGFWEPMLRTAAAPDSLQIRAGSGLFRTFLSMEEQYFVVANYVVKKQWKTCTVRSVTCSYHTSRSRQCGLCTSLGASSLRIVAWLQQLFVKDEWPGFNRVCIKITRTKQWYSTPEFYHRTFQ